jgi:alpha-glucosidase (family GH31 glycosyl hydrolase)
LAYQRTYLYKISQVGGALVTPLFVDYIQENIYTPSMVDTVMYGDALKVDFVFDSDKQTKDIILPSGSYWLDVF